MKVLYKNPGFKYSIDSIMLFQTEEQPPFWSDTLFYFYPQIQKEAVNKRSPSEQKRNLTAALSAVYDEIKCEIDSKVISYNAHFERHREQIEDALSEAFDMDTRAVFNDLEANITMNPVCPRFLREHRFDVFYKNSEKGALGISIHEIIHYIWFYVWNSHFGDSYDEYETPSLKWILSEMIVENIMGDRRLSSVNPYFPREDGGCVYPYFLDMVIEGAPVLDTLGKMYRNNKITDFMENAYSYCLKNEDEIRYHIREAEKAI